MHISRLDKQQKNFWFWICILMSMITIIAFGIAIFTLPISWPFCAESCISYPYTQIISRFPRDYIWMYFAILLMILFVIFSSLINNLISKEKRVFSNIWFAFAIMSSTVLLIDFFIQISVIQPSLLRWESDSISIFTQYNPHGIFIVLEELGYLIMSISFLFFWMALENFWIRKWVKRIFFAWFSLTISSFILISFFLWINREYIFEIAAISINWAVLILNWILIWYLFKANQ
ncbi:MAG: hypothetical protein ACD_3C00226G0003 [uncultured bacterium (gcode 4)]|uniref:DUF998 domain-containing protein n=1 Tax=uncultured bacterium (gcode 4) TaxID=1234023 RepID=K2GAT7_9BACT|nr:MAG: hypothetical protein ACD_3C00226G0003 [uncultured bacterium (gcode 4)]